MKRKLNEWKDMNIEAYYKFLKRVVCQRADVTKTHKYISVILFHEMPVFHISHFPFLFSPAVYIYIYVYIYILIDRISVYYIYNNI